MFAVVDGSRRWELMNFLAVEPLGGLVKAFPDHLAGAVLGACEQVVQGRAVVLGIEQLLHDALGILVQYREVCFHIAGNSGRFPHMSPWRALCRPALKPANISAGRPAPEIGWLRPLCRPPLQQSAALHRGQLPQVWNPVAGPVDLWAIRPRLIRRPPQNRNPALSVRMPRPNRKVFQC
jgi:hypothetical protein